jgi:hypothetical protein
LLRLKLGTLPLITLAALGFRGLGHRLVQYGRLPRRQLRLFVQSPGGAFASDELPK